MPIPLTATVLPNGNLRIEASPRTRVGLRRRLRSEDRFDIWDALEDLTANDEYDWCRPEWVGALTDAPMLATFGETVPVPNDGAMVDGRLAGCWPDERGIDRTWIDPVEKCWAYMDYQILDPIEELITEGVIEWEAGQ